MKATILLAEDEQAMREVLTDYFTAKSGGDFTVVSAPDGDTALHLIETRRFDLLLLDIMLPGTDGFALCRAARRAGRRAHSVRHGARGRAGQAARLRPRCGRLCGQAVFAGGAVRQGTGAPAASAGPQCREIR